MAAKAGKANERPAASGRAKRATASKTAEAGTKATSARGTSASGAKGPKRAAPTASPPEALATATGAAEGIEGTRALFTVFLDRDGVLNEDPGHWQVRTWRSFRWLPGAKEAMARLGLPHVRTCLVTNQPGTAVGLTTKGMVRALHARMLEELRQAGARLDRIEVCFAPPLLPHRRRKPRPGMLEDAAAAFAAAGVPVDKARAVMVGDKLRDARAAAAFGIPAILVASKEGKAALAARADRAGVPYLAVVDGLPDAVDLVLAWV